MWVHVSRYVESLDMHDALVGFLVGSNLANIHEATELRVARRR
jgi:hypothetical protein